MLLLESSYGSRVGLALCTQLTAAGAQQLQALAPAMFPPRQVACSSFQFGGALVAASSQASALRFQGLAFLFDFRQSSLQRSRGFRLEPCLLDQVLLPQGQ